MSLYNVIRILGAARRMASCYGNRHQARTQGFEKGGYIVEKIFIEFLALMLSYSSIMQE